MTQVFIQTGTHDSSSLSIRSGGLVGTYKFNSLTRSIVDFLAAFNRKLYFGYMHREVFLYGHYLGAKEDLIRQMLQPETLTQDRHRHLGFFMYMARVGQAQRWKYPALLNRHPDGRLEQVTGRNRALVSLLVHDFPWDHYPILLAEHLDFDAGAVLKDPILIANDHRLHEVLGVDPGAKEWSTLIEVSLIVEQVGSGLWCKLDYVGNGYYHDHDPKAGRDLLAQYELWHRQYAKPIPLAVYTQWPHLLIDRAGIFDIKIVGSSEGMLLDDHPATVELKVRSYHNNPTHPQDHVLWVVGPRTIDLADLLFWMNTTHSTYISTDWQFILWRRQPEYVNQLITISQAVG